MDFDGLLHKTYRLEKDDDKPAQLVTLIREDVQEYLLCSHQQAHPAQFLKVGIGLAYLAELFKEDLPEIGSATTIQAVEISQWYAQESYKHHPNHSTIEDDPACNIESLVRARASSACTFLQYLASGNPPSDDEVLGAYNLTPASR